MNNRKIILIILVVVLLTVALWGILVWLENYSRNNNLKVNKISEPTATPTVNKQNAPAPANISEEAIQQKIEEKQKEIQALPAGSAKTDDQVYFLFNPREAAIKDLKNQ